MAIHIERAGERFGPYSQKEVQRHLAKGDLVPGDLAWRSGMTEWKPLAEWFPGAAPGNLASTPRTAGSKPPAPARTTRRFVIAGLAVLLIAVAYLSYPYFALWGLTQALETGDRKEIGERIDFASVRQGLKEDLSAYFDQTAKQRSGGKDDPFGEMIGAMARPLMEGMIESMVTPEALAELIAESKVPRAEDGSPAAGSDSPDASLEWSEIDYAFFTSPTRFLVDTDGVKLSMNLTRSGWKVVRVQVSPEMFEEAMK